MATLKQKKITKKIEHLFKDYRGSYIYLVKCHDFYKIGKACSIENRLNSLQCGNPYELELVWAAKVVDADFCEEKLHEVFKEKRMFREWFKLTIEDVNSIIKLVDLGGNAL